MRSIELCQFGVKGTVGLPVDARPGSPRDSLDSGANLILEGTRLEDGDLTTWSA